MDIEEIRGAVARGWCAPKNVQKEMDTDLGEAIAQEIHKALVAEKQPFLGCATTLDLIKELEARATTTSEKWPHYRTVDK